MMKARKNYWIADDYTGTLAYRHMRYIRESKNTRVYLIFNKETGLTKIGISTNVKNRKRNLENSCGVKLELLLHATMEADYSPKAADVEKYLHRHFSKKRKVGEWFNLSVRDIIQVARLFTAIRPRDLLYSPRGKYNPFSKKDTVSCYF